MSTVEEQSVDMDTITAQDEMKSLSLADFKRYRRRVREELNEVLQEFQREVIGSSSRLNYVWNATNAVLRALLDAGLVTPQSVEAAGRKLMEEARANVSAAVKAADVGGRPSPGSLTQTPLEALREAVYGGAKKKE